MDFAAIKSTLPPLFRVAIQQGDLERVVRHLADGRDVNSTDQRGRTPLMFAVAGGHLDLCRLLLEYGANPDALDGAGTSAMDMARDVGQGEIAELIRIHGQTRIPSMEREAEPDPFSAQQSTADSAAEPESEFFGGWEAEDVVSIPVDDKGFREDLIKSSEDISGRRLNDWAGEWDGIEIDLPNPDGLAAVIGFQQGDTQSLLSTLIGYADEYGFFKRSQIDTIARDVGNVPEDEVTRHLLQMMGDLGFVQDDDEAEWLSWPLIDEELAANAEECWRYLQDLSAKTNDPYAHLAKDIQRSTLLDRDGEERIGLRLSLAIKDAIQAISLDANAMAALLELERKTADDSYLAGKISRIDVDEDDDGNTLLSEKFSSLLADSILAWTSRGNSTSNGDIVEALEQLELTMFGIKAIHRMLVDAGSFNQRLDEVVNRGIRIEREMFMANIRLAISVAEKYRRSMLPRMDRIQEAYLGLLRAIEKFDFRKGFKFSTYATWWLKQTVTRAIADKSRLIRLPVHIVEKSNRISKAARLAGFDSPLRIPLAQLVDATDYSESEIRKILALVDDVSMWGDSPSDQAEAMAFEDESADPVAFVEKAEMERIVKSSLDEIPEREAEIIRHRFGMVDGVERTLEEVGQMYGLTRERIRQLESKALTKLRHPKRNIAVLKGYVAGKYIECEENA